MTLCWIHNTPADPDCLRCDRDAEWARENAGAPTLLDVLAEGGAA